MQIDHTLSIWEWVVFHPIYNFWRGPPKPSLKLLDVGCRCFEKKRVPMYRKDTVHKKPSVAIPVHLYNM